MTNFTITSTPTRTRKRMNKRRILMQKSQPSFKSKALRLRRQSQRYKQLKKMLDLESLGTTAIYTSMLQILLEQNVQLQHQLRQQQPSLEAYMPK